MSLVAAYGFSDDSEEDETENENEGESIQVPPLQPAEYVKIQHQPYSDPLSGEKHQHHQSQNKPFDTLLKGTNTHQNYLHS